MATYTEFETGVRLDIEETTATVWASTSLMRWTNDGAKDFARKTKVLEDEQYADTVAGQNSYELPTYTLEPLVVFYAGTPLDHVGANEFFLTAAQHTAQGTPALYTAYSGALYVHPTPNAAGELRYLRTYRPDPIVAGTNTMPFASEYDDALCYYVKARAYEQVGDERAQYFRSLYEREVLEAESEKVTAFGKDAVRMPSEAW